MKDNKGTLFLKGEKAGISAGLTYALAIMSGFTSVISLIYADQFYNQSYLWESYVPNDIVTLGLAVPILLLTFWLSQRGSLKAGLLWGGAVFYLVYNSIVYVVAMPINWFYIVYAANLGISSFLMLWIIQNTDAELVKERVGENKGERFTGWLLTGFGIIFILRAVGLVWQAISLGELMLPNEIALNVADFCISVIWIIFGVSLIRRKPLGYRFGFAALFQAVTLMVGLLVYMIISVPLTGTNYQAGDFVVIAAWTALMVVPLVMFIRK